MAKSKRYNILFLEIGFAQGGSSNFLYHRIKLMNRCLFNPAIAFYYENQGPDLKKLKLLGVPIFFLVSLHQWYKDYNSESSENVKRYSLRKKIKTIFKVIYELFIQIKLFITITSTIHECQIHLVVLNNDIHYHVPGILAAKICKKPIICRKAGIGNGGRIVRLLVPIVDLIFVISRATEKDALSQGAKPDQLIRMYEGICLSDYQPDKFNLKKLQIRKKFNIASDATIIGTVSRLTPTKGQAELLQAASLLLKEHNNLFFLIVGDDGHPSHPYFKILEKQVENLGLDNYVKLVGWYENIPEILAIMDIFVQNPNYPEGLGIANLEAMAMAIPTIVTNMGGLNESTVHEESGIILQSNDPEELAAAINRLIRNRKLSIEMGQQGRKRIASMFDLIKNVGDIDRLFYQVAL